MQMPNSISWELGNVHMDRWIEHLLTTATICRWPLIFLFASRTLALETSSND